MIPTAEQPIREVRNTQQALFWLDGSKISQETGSGIAYHVNPDDSEWKIRRTYLGKKKALLDAELWAISDALILALEQSRTQVTQVTR